ncbi:hypothetical protein O7634_03455 [Micromonospora sp. WMMD1120]|uniref:hypothetical protein n=1 Tax=Micromonospora sp. WMMD1120 TaxID=3016106 RepID=UPI002417AA1E|nr:hypothetical protein [Micromonospora sp. WMMD1120]MDG4805809.1 hypothetical protein [Micromonospora sp. WMMD1120]
MKWLTDRRRDVAGWLVTPLLTLLAAPVLACIGGFTASYFYQPHGTPGLCEEAAADNMCEETTLRVVGWHVLIAGVMWLLLWAIPWWRGLRTPRTLLAVAATAVVVLLAVRLAA